MFCDGIMKYVNYFCAKKIPFWGKGYEKTEHG